MKLVLISAIVLVSLTTYTGSRRVREDTAKATKEVAQDAKAVAQGVVDGVKDKGPVNISKASSDELKKLPGIVDAAAPSHRQPALHDDSYDPGEETLRQQKVVRPSRPEKVTTR